LADDVQRRFPLRGTLDFVNNTVDPQTGTLQVRGVLPNPYKPGVPPVLVPGLFVRVRLTIGLPHKVLLITERAIGTDQGQKYVYIIDKDNQVVYRRVKLGMLFDGLQAIEEGLEPGDRVVVNGLQRIQPGVKVETEEVNMATLAGPEGAQLMETKQDTTGKKADGKKPAAEKPAGEKSGAAPAAPKS
jgi:RND family efflux transporter MFP subunit